MSKSIKTIARIALPIAAGAVLGPAGFGLTSTAVGSAIGGALGGAMGGGGVKGALLGGLTGYASGGMTDAIVGKAAGTTLDVASGVAGAQGPTYGSGIAGALSGGGMRAAFLPATGAAASGAAGAFDPSKYLLTMGNQLMTNQNMDAAKDASGAQAQAIQKGLQLQSPYLKLGQTAVTNLNNIQSDPVGYIQGNEMYNTMAADAQRRLLANQAAKGKVGSGGTVSALQEKLLMLGNDLMQQQVGNYTTQAGLGSNAAQTSANMYGDLGDVRAAGIIGENNAFNDGYQNQLNTLLAMKNLNTAPTYAKPINL